MRRIIFYILFTVTPTFALGQPTVYLKNLGAGQSYSGTPGSDGVFKISNVEPGTYTLLLEAPQSYFIQKSKQGSLPITVQNIRWYPSSTVPVIVDSSKPAATQITPPVNGSVIGISFTSQMLSKADKDPSTSNYYVTIAQSIQIVVTSTLEGEVTNSVPGKNPMGK